MSHKILLVDDSPTVRYLVRAYIERETDWQICGEAQDGKEAIEKVKDLSPDAVILDFQMPVMNGLEAAKQISKTSPAILLLMFTLHKSMELDKVAHEAGIKDVISKSGGMPGEIISAIRTRLG
jgi:two-component system, NarL family, response regulator NreC